MFVPKPSTREFGRNNVVSKVAISSIPFQDCSQTLLQNNMEASWAILSEICLCRRLKASVLPSSPSTFLSSSPSPSSQSSNLPPLLPTVALSSWCCFLAQKGNTGDQKGRATHSHTSAYLVALRPVYCGSVFTFLCKATVMDRFSFMQALSCFKCKTNNFPNFLSFFVFHPSSVFLLVVACYQDSNSIFRRIFIIILSKQILFYIPYQIVLASSVSDSGCLFLLPHWVRKYRMYSNQCHLLRHQHDFLLTPACPSCPVVLLKFETLEDSLDAQHPQSQNAK